MGDRTNPGFRLDASQSDDSRLSALERSHMEMAVQLGKHEISMTYLSQDIKRGFDDLTAIVKPMADKVIKFDDMLDSHELFIAERKQDMKDAQKDELQARKDKRAFKMKAFGAIVLAVCSAFGTYAWEHWISKYLIH